MARPGLRSHPKFRRLLHLLREPVPHVWGYLECMWEVGYQSGNPVLGDALDVELAAEYPGEPGKLCQALLDCRLIDQLEEGRFQIHDLVENAPGYVSERAAKETERRKEKSCEHCGHPYHSTEAHSRYCSGACRQAAYRGKQGAPSDAALRSVTQGSVTVTQRNGPPSTAQPVTAQPITDPTNPPSGGGAGDQSPRSSRPRNRKTTSEVIPAGFLEFWEAYPRKIDKQDALKAWTKLAPNADLVRTILDALDLHKRSDQWTKDDGRYIPHPATWLNKRRWEAQLLPANGTASSNTGWSDTLRRFAEGGDA